MTRLEVVEAEISATQERADIALGRLYRRIRDEKLYEDGGALTFKDYCESKRCKHERPHVYRLIKLANSTDEAEERGDAEPASERQVRRGTTVSPTGDKSVPERTITPEAVAEALSDPDVAAAVVVKPESRAALVGALSSTRAPVAAPEKARPERAKDQPEAGIEALRDARSDITAVWTASVTLTQYDVSKGLERLTLRQRTELLERLLEAREVIDNVVVDLARLNSERTRLTAV